MAIVTPIHMGAIFNRKTLRNSDQEPYKFCALVGSNSHQIELVTGDVVYMASFTIQNMVSGSEYWVAQTANLANVLMTGTSSGSDVVYSLPCSTENMTITIRVRKSGYIPFELLVSVPRGGASAYIIQSVDPTA
jgi:hypothetical protein